MKLFEPLRIRGLDLRNRIVMPAMQTNIGYRNRRGIAYYSERARGGAGALIGAAVPVDVLISDDAWGRPGAALSFVEGTHSLTQAVHQAGARIGLQLVHNNYFPAGIGLNDVRGKPIAPSAIIEPEPPRHPWIKACQVVHEVTGTEIQAIVAKFAQAAARAKMGKFDFVEFHGAHGYLPCQFFSPIDNHRNDKYGGDLSRRMRFGLDCVAAIRAAVGEDYPLFFRLGCEESQPGGITLTDASEFAVQLEKAGVDVLHLSWGGYIPWRTSPGPENPMGTYLYMAEAIKPRVHIPVMAVGRINDPKVAEAIIADGKADLVAIGRQLIADPFWPEKVRTGRFEDVTPCLSCNTCVEEGPASKEFRCVVNASAGREAEYEIRPANLQKKVFVVGGGPAGMEAARVAAARGHEVTLFEKEKRLGGQLLIASVPPHKEMILRLVDYLAGQLRKTGVKVELSSNLTKKMVNEASPDVVILATGAVPIEPRFAGARKKNVTTALKVIAGHEVGVRVVIVGGGMVGCETADHLSRMGKRVTIIEMLDEIGKDMVWVARAPLLLRLTDAGVGIAVKAKVEGITDKGVKATREGESVFFEGDSVVLAVGMRPNRELAEKLENKVKAIYVIGDCDKPRKILDAISDGARVGREV